MPEMNINYTALLTAAFICFVLGAFWYSPLLFAKQWKAAVGKTDEELKKMGSPILGYLVSLVVWIIVNYVLANIVNFAGANTLGNGMIIGFLCWLGFVAAFTLMFDRFEHKPIGLWLINGGYALAGLLISGAIFGVWK